MYLQSITINEQGQIVIPKVFRDYLNSNNLIIQKDEGNSIKLIPIPDLGGSLAKYKTKNIDFKKARNQAWNEEIYQKFNKDK